MIEERRASTREKTPHTNKKKPQHTQEDVILREGKTLKGNVLCLGQIETKCVQG